MKVPNAPNKRRARAERALRGAILLIEDGDYEGACSRAYYAMFHAASSIVAAAGTGDATSYKTHSGLIAAFHRTLVLPGSIDREHGRALSRAFEMRSFADYADVPCQKHDAAIMIEQASAFLDAVFGHLESYNTRMPPAFD